MVATETIILYIDEDEGLLQTFVFNLIIKIDNLLRLFILVFPTTLLIPL